MTTWTDEQDLVLVHALARSKEWHRGAKTPLRFVRRDLKPESIVREFLRAIVEPKQA